MLRVNGNATLQRKVLALYCLLALVLPGCGPRRTASSDLAVPMVKSNPGKAKNPYRAVKRKDLSRHIRAVFRASAEHYDAERMLQATASEAIPEDPEIQSAARALEEDPNNWSVARRLADLYMAANRHFEAFELYSRLQVSLGEDPEVSRALATIWDRWGDYPRALEHAAQALGFDHVADLG